MSTTKPCPSCGQPILAERIKRHPQLGLLRVTFDQCIRCEINKVPLPAKAGKAEK